MGYMGFGLQKWIYTMKPRRPFSRDRKPTGNTIDTYSVREFDELPVPKIENIKDKKTAIKKANQRIKISKARYRSEYNLGVIKLSIIITVLIVITIYFLFKGPMP